MRFDAFQNYIYIEKSFKNINIMRIILKFKDER